MDEIDAALDPVNVHKVASYIARASARGELQALVISLKDAFYEKASGIVGVFRDVARASSGTLTLDLDAFAAEAGAPPPAAPAQRATVAGTPAKAPKASTTTAR